MTPQGPDSHHIASFQKPRGNRVQCLLCPHLCVVAEGETGTCGVRAVRDGRLESLVYGRPAAMAVDPIEKKPLFHFMPAARTFSYATRGCNLVCSYCQNFNLSQSTDFVPAAKQVSPERMVAAAQAEQCAVIAHTYSEPTIYFEYAHDIARLARADGLKNVFVTNGFINADPLEQIAPFMDGANVDLKSFSDETYRKHCNGRLQPVLDTITRMHDAGVWVEVTTLLIPGLNDGAAELKALCDFIAGVSPSIPWHVSRFHPDFNMLDRPATSLASLEQAADAGRAAGLQFIYLGNVRGHNTESTLCPNCASVVVARRGFSVLENRLAGNCCPDCGQVVAGAW